MKELSFTVDRNLRIRSWSCGIAEFTGRSSRRAVGKRYFDVFPRIIIGELDAVSKAFKEQKTVSFRRYHFPCLYAQISASLKISPVTSGTGRASQAKVMFYPTASCSMAKRLNRSEKFVAIGKVASTLAHGVKNPLNAIKGAVVYLRDRYSHEEQLLEFTKIMEDEISRLKNFIARFLGEATSPGESTSVDVNALVGRIKIFVSLQAYAHNIRCEYALGTVPPLMANPFHIEQALLNIINNALEAMKSEGTLKISTLTEKNREGRFIVIEIMDTGPGMDVKNIEELELDHAEGRGFGLSIAYEMVKYYDGRLEIRGEKGSGTTVRFYLPCGDAAKN